MENRPLKRHAELQPLSREHHHELLLCWKIRTGLTKNIEVSRIRNYAVWFYEHHLLPHFKTEEKYLFPILGNEHHLIKRALSEHRKISRLVLSETYSYKNLNLIEEVLERHIRFEERILFNEIQFVATNEQLQKIASYHSDTKFADNLTDVFWE
ncbi:MAG: hemerythrin domain-containing protein [Bacteroidia bacterium]|nr:hemerythrin domain-containing protein [Bacteroidia bacterium]